MKITAKIIGLMLGFFVIFGIVGSNQHSQANFSDNILGNMNLFAINDSLWTPKVFDMPDKSYTLVRHSSADEESISIGSNVLENIVLSENNYETFQKTIRQQIIKKMMQEGFSGFVARPLQTANNVITFSTGDLKFQMIGIFDESDNLDILLKSKLAYYKKHFDDYKKFSSFADFPELILDKNDLLSMKDIFLFKDDSDLQNLGYEIISYRSRINNDKEYRRHNISTAFANMGNLVILNPDRKYNLMSELHYSKYKDDGKKAFMRGYAIFGSVEKLVYAGGLCGVATAVSQGILTNTGIEIIEKKAHSKRYRDLYTATVDGELVDKPGLDATVYSTEIDVKFQNIRNYPIILVMNYDGSYGGLEQVFTLAPIENKGEFSYIGESKKGHLKCYSREVNGEIIKNCYNKIVMN